MRNERLEEILLRVAPAVAAGAQRVVVGSLAAREPALRKFLANCGAEILPGETLEQAVRRVQLVIFGVIRHAAETALPNESFQQSMDRVLSRRN